MRSNKPKAKAFRKWVTSEVLPAIRRQGFYINPELADPKQLRRIANEMYNILCRYLSEEDKKAVGRKWGINKWDMISLMDGRLRHNAALQDLQKRAIANKTAEINAYAPARMQEVLLTLKG
jgi:prophage antirepressor-like protein